MANCTESHSKSQKGKEKSVSSVLMAQHEAEYVVELSKEVTKFEV